MSRWWFSKHLTDAYCAAGDALMPIEHMIEEAGRVAEALATLESACSRVGTTRDDRREVSRFAFTLASYLPLLRAMRKGLSKYPETPPWEDWFPST